MNIHWINGIITFVLSFISCLYVARMIDPELKSFDSKMVVFTIIFSFILGLAITFWQ